MINVGMWIPVLILLCSEIQLWKIIFFWHIRIVNQNQYPHHFLHSLPKATTPWQMSFLKQFLKAGISECAPSIPTVQKTTIQCPRKCPCYQWYVFNTVIYITCHKHKYYYVWRLTATVAWKKKGGHTWRKALNQGILQLPPALDPKIKSLVFSCISTHFWSGFHLHLN